MENRQFQFSTILAAVVLTIAALPVSADLIVRVADLDPGPGPGNFTINEPVAFQGAIYFDGCDGSDCELWRSDGLPDGVTARVADIYPGPTGSFPSQFVVAGSTLFFRATGPNGTELWKSDGTPGGTVEVADIYPGAEGSSPTHLTAVGSTVYFAAWDPTNGVEPWKSNGTAAGTAMVANLSSGSDSSYPAGFLGLGTRVLFTARNASGREPWVTDGTILGTERLADIFPGSGSSLPSNRKVFAQLGPGAYFAADDGDPTTANTLGLWFTGGTPATTFLVRRFDVGGPYEEALETAAINGKVFLGLASRATVAGLPARGALWVSDGLAPGTERLATFALSLDRQGPIGRFAASGGIAYFPASTRDYGLELWRSDGTVDGTWQVNDVWRGAASAAPSPVGMSFGLVMRARDPVAGTEVWSSDGTANGTTRLRDFYMGRNSGNLSNTLQPFPAAELGGFAYFTARDNRDISLWRSDGTAAGTVEVFVGSPGGGSSAPLEITAFGSTVLFSAVTPSAGREPWISDGTTAGTVPLGDLAPGGEYSAAELFTPLGPIALFRAYTPATGWELFRTDGTAAGTGLAADIVPGPDSSEPTAFTVFGNHVYLRACTAALGCELWRSDGTAIGTTLVADLLPGALSSFPEELTAIAGKLLFRATTIASGTELWASDGSAAGTALVRELASGAASSLPQVVKSGGARAFFIADDGTHGLEPWSSDGTAAGTWLLGDLAGGTEDSNRAWNSSQGSAVLAGHYYLAVDDDGGVTAADVWKSDGTPAGTAKIVEMDPFGHVGEMSSFGAAGGLVHFGFRDPVTIGLEPWRTDGTPGGTLPLGDLYPGASGSNPVGWAGNRNLAFFRATVSGTTRLWRSDGTPGGTFLAGSPGDPEVIPAGTLVHVGNRVFFLGIEDASGAELFALVELLFADGFESGDLTAWSAHQP